MPRPNVEVTAARLAEMVAEVETTCSYPSCADNFEQLWPNHNRDRYSRPLTIGTVTTPNMVTYDVCSTCYCVLIASVLGRDCHDFYNNGFRGDRVTANRAESAIGYRRHRNYTYTPNEKAALAAARR